MPGAELNVLVAVAAGLLSFLSPCVLPLLPSYLSFIAGISFEELQGTVANPRTRRALFVNSVLFVGGFSLVFSALGAGATLAGQVLFQYQVLIRRVGGALVVLMGLYVAGWLRIPFLMREWRAELTNRPAGYLGAVLTGITFAAGWTPCIGPILAGILAVAGAQETVAEGVKLLAVYSLGLGVPFLLTALAVDSFFSAFARIRRYYKWVEIASGVLLVAIGVLIFTNRFTIIAQWLTPYLPTF